MRKALSISLVLAVALAGTAFAAPVETTGSLDKFQYLDLSNPNTGLKGASTKGVFGAAQGGTTYFGGTVWNGGNNRWEAIQDSCWTFDTGVGSDFVHYPTNPNVDPFKDNSLHAQMEGWIGYDNTFGGSNPYFRRLSDSNPNWTTVCVGAGPGLGGNWSFYCGVLSDEADNLCYVDGQGYGNSWVVSIEKSFAYSGSGSATLNYDYIVDTEPGFDYMYADVDTSNAGDWVNVATYTGNVSGSESISLTAGNDLPAAAGTIKIRFQGAADGAYSDEDGLQPTSCGIGAIDDVQFAGGAIDDFETGDNGWALSAPAAGAGGEWSDIVALADLPTPLTTCVCDLQDSVLVFEDITVNGHGLFQDNLAASPWIDLQSAGLAGAPIKFIQTNLYAELPLLNYIFVQFNVQWYPEVCPVNGNLITSAFTSNGFVYYFGGVPTCTAPGAVGTQIDFSDIAAPGAQEMRIAVGVLSYCRFFGNCTGVSNSTPWFDYVKFGIGGDPDAPFISSSTIDLPMDSFPQNGQLRLNAPGRIDCNNVKGDSQPESGTSLGDTLIVAGAKNGAGNNTNAEVFVVFAVDGGPGIDGTALNTWLTSHTSEGSWNGQNWYSAEMDTAIQGNVTVVNTWATLYHEDDPNFTGTDTATDPNDLDPAGQQTRKLNDIFPDNLFTPGTRVNMYYKTRYVDSGGTPTTGVWYLFPDTTGGNFLEMEVLPSSAEADSTWNCVLYVDHFDGRGAQGFIENGLANSISGTSGNFEQTPWDRWDVRAPSSQQASFGRPLNTQYGATVVQTFAYDVIVWNSGNLAAFNLVEEDAAVLRPWLNLLGGLGLGFNNFYGSGDGLAKSMTVEAISEPSALQMLEVDLGVSYTCDSIRDASCPGSPSLPDTNACIAVDPVGGPIGNSGAVVYQGNGCPQQRAFDLLNVSGSAAGTPVGDEVYTSTVKGALQFASIANEAAGGPDYKTVVDGGSVHYRFDQATCSVQGPDIDDRIDRVLSWFGYAGAAQSCNDPTLALDVFDGRGDRPSGFVTALAAGRPNPYQGQGVVTLGFSTAAKGRATLEVFDVNGRLVKTVVDEIFEAGNNHQVTWDGTDNGGSSVASGVYFYRLKTNGEEFAKKLVVVRNGGN